MNRVLRRVAVLALSASFLAQWACATQQPAPGVSRVNKPIMRRGHHLDEDITRFLRTGYLLIGTESFDAETFAEGSGAANLSGRRRGAHLIVAYENPDVTTLRAAAAPVFMPEAPFSTPHFRSILGGVRGGRVVDYYWARPDRPLPLGVFFHEHLPDAARAEAGDRPAVQIRAIIRGSPAAQGYLLNGDVVTHLDGQVVSGDPKDLVEALIPKRGTRVTFTVLRDGDPQDKEVALYP